MPWYVKMILCRQRSGIRKESEMAIKKLVLLHSNDLHGDYLPEIRDGVETGGLARLSGYVKRARQEEDNVIYANAGDMFRGSIIDSEYLGLSTIDLMNCLAPDVTTIGNHEVDYGIAHLLFLEKCAHFPIVNANLYVTMTNTRLFRPYLTVERDGVRIMFIGILTEEVLSDLRNASPELFDNETPFIQAFVDWVQEWTRKNGSNLGAMLRDWAEAEPKIASPESMNAVRVMTVHKSKGLEFPYVIFPFAEKVTLYKPTSYWCRPDVGGTPLEAFADGVYHVELSGSSESTLFAEDYRRERKLQFIDNINVFYVALTRAEEQCYLTHAQNRYRFGKSEFCTPSIFLREIDSRYLDVQQSGGERQRKPISRFDARSPFESGSPFTSESPFATRFTSTSIGSRSAAKPSTPPPTFSLHSTTAASQPEVSSTQTPSGILVVGSRIEHSRFGRGEVIALAGSGIDAKATVKFENVGTKQLLLRFAKFTIL